MRELGTARRFLVYGVTGSGKTTAAGRVSEATGIQWHDVDQLTWEPNWVPVSEPEQRRRIEAICEADTWVLDTAYGIWLDVPLSRADVVVALDYPRWLSLARLIRRTASRVLGGQEVCNGNTETWDRIFAKDSIIVWHFRSFSRKRDRIRRWALDPQGPLVVRCRWPRDLDALVTRLAEQRAAA